MQQMSLFFLLLLGELALISVPGEAVNNVYYVTPTEPPNSDCPGEPCQKLVHYFSHGDRYFSSNNINVTMILLHGKHALKSRRFHIIPYEVKDLEIFEMIGMEPAHDVVVHLFNNIQLINITTAYIETLTFTREKPYGNFLLYGFTVNPRQSSETIIMDRAMSVTINSTLFNGVPLSHNPDDVLNFYMIVANSTFTNQSFFNSKSSSVGDPDRVRHLKVKDCTFRNSNLQLVYINAKITIENSTIIDNDNNISTNIRAHHSDIEFAGNMQFSASNMTGSLYMLYSSCNVTITGDVTFANNKPTPITAYSSTITLSGNVSFLNNTGIKGCLLYTSDAADE